jgi:hypothetical protein
VRDVGVALHARSIERHEARIVIEHRRQRARAGVGAIVLAQHALEKVRRLDLLYLLVGVHPARQFVDIIAAARRARRKKASAQRDKDSGPDFHAHP